MKHVFWIKSYIFLAIVLITVNACTSLNEVDVAAPEENLMINLRWFEGSFMQTEDEMRVGLAWSLSSLGAMLPVGALDGAVTDLGNNVFTIDLSLVGFTPEAEEALQVVVTALKTSEAYSANNYTELGRFVALTLNSSFHYFEIVGLPPTLTEFLAQYEFEGTQVRIVNSTISEVQRLVEIAEADRFEEIAYFATEGTGDFNDGTFEAVEFEVFDFMPNGQLRLGLYGIDGRLKAAADPLITRAGKPAKCLWCHEINIQPFFGADPVLPGDDFLSEADFNEIRDRQVLFLAEHRASLASEIRYDELVGQSLMEHIYIDFLEPAAERLSVEWDLPLETVNVLLENLDTHRQEEFGFPDLYDRIDVDQVGPFPTLEAPEFARELSANEPDLFQLLR